MKKRDPTEEEKALFRDVVEGRIPLSKPTRLVIAEKAAVRKPAPKLPTGINGGTSERLHRGDLRPEARLDLHGYTEQAAYRALSDFILRAVQRNLRLVLVITGKGIKQADRFAAFDMEYDTRARGVLRNMVPRWLNEAHLVRHIADVRHAHVRHGGEGALYVYLRKRDV